MTVQEAIEIGKKLYNNIKHGTANMITVNDYIEYIEKSNSALEKQIAKKPLYSKFEENGFGKIIPYEAECPTCGYEFEFGTFNEEENYHCVCGQKLDWSN